MAHLNDDMPVIDWVTRVPVTRADYYGPESPEREGTIRSLRLTRATVHSDQVATGRVTIALDRKDHESYGVEFDFTSDGCRQLAALLLAAADHVDAGGEPKDFKLEPAEAAQ